MPTQTTVIFCKKSITLTRAQLEVKAKKQAAKNPPTASALHRIFVPGIKAAVSPNWFATYILDTPVLVPNRIAMELGANANGAALRGAYNPAQVLRAAKQMESIGVKAESSSASTSYANFSDAAREKLAKALKAMGANGGKVETKTTTKKQAAKKSAPRKPRNKPNGGNDAAPVDSAAV